MRVRKTASATAAIAGAALVGLATPGMAQAAEPGNPINLPNLGDILQPQEPGTAQPPPAQRPAPRPAPKPAPPKPVAPPNAGSEGTIKGTVPGTGCSVQADACLSLSNTRAVLIKDGKVSYGPVPITTGKPGHETPVGMHQVQWKDIDHKSREFNNAPMNYSVFFTTNGIAFHEGDLDEQSHGCVHLSRKAAQTFYNALQPGDKVQVIP